MASMKALQTKEMATTMKAVRFHSYGGPEVLSYEDVPRPNVATGEVLICVHAAGVNPLDWKIRAGYMKGLNRLPLIPGWDVAGVVDTIGPGVRSFKEGEAVFGLLDFSRDGAYAEYVAARASVLAPKPKTLDFVQAAAIPLTSLAAWQSIFDIAGLSRGQTILIHAAAGGVGTMAVQLARWKGARVIGTASSKNAKFVKDLGADEVIDYHATRFEDVVRDVDVVLDTIGGDTQERSWTVLRKGGILVSTLGIASPETGARLGMRSGALSVHPDEAELSKIAGLIDAGAVKPAVTTVLPLAEASKAHQLSETGHARGKIVLKVGG